MDLVLFLLRLSLAASLYLFLGAMFWLLWRDLAHRSSPAELQTPRQYGRLLVVEVASTQEQGAERLPQPGEAFPLHPFTTIGRAKANTVTLPDAYASAEHALLSWRGGQWRVEDRGSRNGTTVNGLLIDGPTVVSAGDVIGIGQVELKLELLEQ